MPSRTVVRIRAVAAATVVVAVGAAGLEGGAPVSAGGAVGLVTEFSIPTANGGLGGIAAGPDGNLWFTLGDRDKIGRITPTGTVVEFALPTLAGPVDIAAGPDGNLWFTEFVGNKIGRITPAGTVEEFVVPTADSNPNGIAAGPDGNLWFTMVGAAKIGRITPSGTITEFGGIGGQATGIAAGPDGNMWFTVFNADTVVRITPTGGTKVFAIPGPLSSPSGIAAGPDGNLWFTQANGNQIGRITPSGSITEFPVPTALSSPSDIAAGPDGNLWFTVLNGNRIGRITPTGAITEFEVPGVDTNTSGIAAGPDGSMWFTKFLGNKVGRITTGFSPGNLQPSLGGTGQVGLPMVCGAAVWGPLATYTVTWQRNGVAIPGQTGLSFAPTDADLGAAVTCTSHGTLPGMLTALSAVSPALTIVPQTTGPTGATGPAGPAGLAGASATPPLVAVFAPGTRGRSGRTATVTFAISRSVTVSLRLAKGGTVVQTTTSARAGTNTAAIRLKKGSRKLKPGRYPLALLGPDRVTLTTTTVTVTR